MEYGIYYPRLRRRRRRTTGRYRLRIRRAVLNACRAIHLVSACHWTQCTDALTTAGFRAAYRSPFSHCSHGLNKLPVSIRSTSVPECRPDIWQKRQPQVKSRISACFHSNVQTAEVSVKNNKKENIFCHVKLTIGRWIDRLTVTLHYPWASCWTIYDCMR